MSLDFTKTVLKMDFTGFPALSSRSTSQSGQYCIPDQPETELDHHHHHHIRLLEVVIRNQ